MVRKRFIAVLVHGCIREASLWGLCDCLYTQGCRYIDANCLILGEQECNNNIIAVILSTCAIQIRSLETDEGSGNTCTCTCTYIPQVLSPYP